MCQTAEEASTRNTSLLLLIRFSGERTLLGRRTRYSGATARSYAACFPLNPRIGRRLHSEGRLDTNPNIPRWTGRARHRERERERGPREREEGIPVNATVDRLLSARHHSVARPFTKLKLYTDGRSTPAYNYRITGLDSLGSFLGRNVDIYQLGVLNCTGKKTNLLFVAEESFPQ